MENTDGCETVELVALGQCDVTFRSQAVRTVASQPKRFGLLAYLALACPRGPHQRDELLALFWPDRSERRARQALSQSLYFLASALGEDALRRDGRTLVGCGPAISSDVYRFEQKLETGDLAGALAEYRGELLPGLHVTGCGDFERWLEGERRRLRSEAVAAARVLSERSLSRGTEEDAVQWARWELEQLPYDEDAAMRLFQLLSGLGRTGELRREFEAYERRLRTDLEVAPSPRIRDLVPDRPAASPEETELADPHEARDGKSGDYRGRLVASLAGLVALVAVGWALRDAGETVRMSPERRQIVVLPFYAVAADAEVAQLARVASDWVARELAASGLGNIVAPQAATARGAGKDTPGADSTAGLPYMASPASGLVVSGQMTQSGNRIAIEVTIREAASQRIVRVLPRAEGGIDDPMKVVQGVGRQVAASVATVLDEQIGSWAEVASQPPSMEAYRAFFDALDWFAAGEADSADHYFLRAAQEDSSFTAPLIWAVRNRVWANRIPGADTLVAILAARRGELAPWDRAMLDYEVAYLRGTWEEAYRAARQVELLAPDPEWSLLVASSAQAANRPQAALEALRRIDRDEIWARDWAYRWRTWTIVHHMLGQYDEELAVAAPQRAENPVWTGLAQIGAYAGLGRLAAIDPILDDLRAKVKSPNGRIQILRETIQELRGHGHHEEAAPLAAEALAIVDSMYAAGDSSLSLHTRGDLLYLAGRWDESYAVLSRIEMEDEHGALLTSLGRAAARIGREEEARRAASELVSDHPLDKGHGAFRAATILAGLGDEAGAMALLEQAVEEGFGYYPWLHTVWEFENLAGYPAFVEFMRPRG